MPGDGMLAAEGFRHGPVTDDSAPLSLLRKPPDRPMRCRTGPCSPALWVSGAPHSLISLGPLLCAAYPSVAQSMEVPPPVVHW